MSAFDSGDVPQPNNNAQDAIVASLMEYQKLIEFLITEFRVHSKEVSVLSALAAENHENVVKLLKLVRDGDGDHSLMRRVDKLEERSLIAQENTKGKWAMIGSGVAGVFSIIAALIALLA